MHYAQYPSSEHKRMRYEYECGVIMVIISLCIRFRSQLAHKPFQRGDRLQRSESDVYGRQILTSIDGPRAEITNNLYWS